MIREIAPAVAPANAAFPAVGCAPRASAGTRLLTNQEAMIITKDVTNLVHMAAVYVVLSQARSTGQTFSQTSVTIDWAHPRVIEVWGNPGLAVVRNRAFHSDSERRVFVETARSKSL